MKETLKLAILLSFCVIGGIFLASKWLGEDNGPVRVIPTIVTRYDTVETLPKWWEDSVKKWKKKVYVTDTVNLLATHVVVDTQYVPVDAPAEQRPDIHPLMYLNAGKGHFGDTVFTQTFSLKTGKTTLSKVFLPGIIVGIDANYPSGTPRIDFEPFYPAEQHGWFYPTKHKLIGAGVGLPLGFLASLAICASK